MRKKKCTRNKYKIGVALLATVSAHVQVYGLKLEKKGMGFAADVTWRVGTYLGEPTRMQEYNGAALRFQSDATCPVGWNFN